MVWKTIWTAWYTCLTSPGKLILKLPCVSFKKGEEVEAVILSIDAEKERISLGIKQLESDPFAEYVTANEKGSIVTGKVIAVDARAATVELAEGIEATLKASEIAAERTEDASTVLSVGDEVEAKITGVDRRNRSINLSIRAKDQAEEKAALNAVRNQEVETKGPTTIGDLIKAQMANQKG